VQLGQAEVENLHPPIGGDHHVLGLEIAVRDALGVRGGEPLCDGARVLHGLARRQRAAFQRYAECRAIEQFLDQIERVGLP